VVPRESQATMRTTAHAAPTVREKAA
jgi:hypothetical protein